MELPRLSTAWIFCQKYQAKILITKYFSCSSRIPNRILQLAGDSMYKKFSQNVKFLIHCITFDAIMLALDLLWFKGIKFNSMRFSEFRICELRIAKIRVVRYVAGKNVLRSAARAHSAGAALHQTFVGATNLHVLDFSPLPGPAIASADSEAAKVYGSIVRGTPLCFAKPRKWSRGPHSRNPGTPSAGSCARRFGQGSTTPTQHRNLRRGGTVRAFALQCAAALVKI